MKNPITPLLSILTLLFLPVALAADGDRAVQAWVGKLDALFTLEEAAKITGRDASQAKTDYLRSAKHPITEVVDYSWKGNRTRMTTGALKMELPVSDSIKVGWLRKATLQDMHALRDTVEGESLEGVGEFAFLAKEGNQYIFFQNGIRFSVWVDVSADPKVNTAHAIATAKLLLKKL